MKAWTNRFFVTILKVSLKNNVQKFEFISPITFYAGSDPNYASRTAQKWSLYNCPKAIQTPPR